MVLGQFRWSNLGISKVFVTKTFLSHYFNNKLINNDLIGIFQIQPCHKLSPSCHSKILYKMQIINSLIEETLQDITSHCDSNVILYDSKEIPNGYLNN